MTLALRSLLGMDGAPAPVAVQYVRTAASGQGASASTTATATFTAPTAGNLLIFAVGVDKDSGVANPITGWTLLSNIHGASTSQIVWYKFATGTETSVTGTWTTASTAANGYVVVEFSGVDPTTPISGFVANPYSDTATTTQTVDIGAAGSSGGLAVAVASIDTAILVPWAITATGWTAKANGGNAQGPGNVALLTYNTPLTAGQDLGPQTFTVPDSDQQTLSGFVLNAVQVSAPSAQTATPNLVTGSPAPLAPAVTTVVTPVPDLVASAPQTFAPSAQVNYVAHPDFIDLLGATGFGTGPFGQSPFGQGGATDQQTFAPTVTPGAVTATPSLLVGSPAVQPPSVRAVVTVTPALLVGTPATFQPNAITAGSALPNTIPFTGQLFAPTLRGGPTSLVAGFIASPPTVYVPTVQATITVAPLFAPASAPELFAPAVHAEVVAVPDALASDSRLFNPKGPKDLALVWFYDQKTHQWYHAPVTFYRKLGWGGEWTPAEVETIGAPVG